MGWRRFPNDVVELLMKCIARQGFDPVFGARPLKRYLQHELETRIGRALIAGEVSDGASVEVDADEAGLKVSVDNPVVEAPEVESQAAV